MSQRPGSSLFRSAVVTYCVSSDSHLTWSLKWTVQRGQRCSQLQSRLYWKCDFGIVETSPACAYSLVSGTRPMRCERNSSKSTVELA